MHFALVFIFGVMMVDEMELRSISSTVAAGSSIGLTIPDVCSFVLLMMGGGAA